MQRETQQNVASRFKRQEQEVPILVPSEGRGDAYASFYLAGLDGPLRLRVLRRGDFNQVLYWSLSKKAQGQLRELVALRQGIAEEGPSFWLQEFLRGKAREGKLGRKVRAALEGDIPKFGRPSRRTVKAIGRGWLFGDPLTRLSVAITKKLSRARLVLWFTGPVRSRTPALMGSRDEIERELLNRVAYLMQFRRTDYVPAIFCPDLETAFYCYQLFEITGRGFGICLHCGEVFQKTRADRLYCCQSHADAYRLRHWRLNKKKGMGRGKK